MRKGDDMDFRLILEGKATLEDLYKLNGFGYEFVLEGGKVTKIQFNGGDLYVR